MNVDFCISELGYYKLYYATCSIEANFVIKALDKSRLNFHVTDCQLIFHSFENIMQKVSIKGPEIFSQNFLKMSAYGKH